MEKTVSSATTLYWPGLTGQIIDESDATATTIAKQVYFGGMLVWHESAATGTGLFLFQDHLGSTRVTATAAGAVEDRVSYYPYGGVIPYSSTTSDNHYGFTGYESDGDSDYATFRNLDTNLGRFNRPDPYDGSYDFSNPQSLNRYTYVGNMPMSFIDPIGLVDMECVTTPSTGYADDGGVTPGTTTCQNTPYQGGIGYLGPFQFFFGSGGGGSAGPSSPPKSKARKTCEQAAQQKYQNVLDSLNAQFSASLRSATMEGIVSGFVTGCLFTSEVGCLGGGVPGAFIGGLSGAAVSATTSTFKLTPQVLAAKSQLQSDLQACSSIP